MWAALVEEAGAAAAMCWPRSRGGGVVVVMVAPCTVGAACGEFECREEASEGMRVSQMGPSCMHLLIFSTSNDRHEIC